MKALHFDKADDRGRHHAWSRCTCASTATARPPGPTRRCAATWPTPGDLLERLHRLTRADCHDPQPPQGQLPVRRLRRPRGAHRRPARAGGARRDPPRPRRRPDHGDPRAAPLARREDRPRLPCSSCAWSAGRWARRPPVRRFSTGGHRTTCAPSPRSTRRQQAHWEAKVAEKKARKAAAKAAREAQE